MLSYGRDKDVKTKLTKFLYVTGIISQVIKPSKAQKQNTINIRHINYSHHVIWQWYLDTIKQDKSRITAEEITFLRISIKYMLFDHKRNHDILKELKTWPVLVQISNYNNTRIQHVNRMERSRLEWAAVKYQPARKRNTGHT